MQSTVMGRAVGAALVSIVFPGIGHGMAGRRAQTITWALLGFLPVVAILVSVWMVFVALLLRVICAIDTFRVLRRETAALEWVTALSGIALVGGMLGMGFAQVSFETFKIPSSSMQPTLVIGDHVYTDKLTLHWRPPQRGEVIVFRYPCDPSRTYMKRVIGVGGDAVEVRCNIIYLNGTSVQSELVATADEYRERSETIDSIGGWSSRPVSRYRETLNGHTYDTFEDLERPHREQRAHEGHAPEVGASHDFPLRDAAFAPSCHQESQYGLGLERGKTPLQQPVGKLVQTKAADVATPCEPQFRYEVPPGSVFVLGDNRPSSNDSRGWGVVSTSDVTGRVIGVDLSHSERYDWSRIGAVH